jgi:DNA-binding response OmpR family regulator
MPTDLISLHHVLYSIDSRSIQRVGKQHSTIALFKLTAWEFNILYFLAIYSGQYWSRQQLIEKIWGWNCDDTGEKQVVSVDIGQIRKQMIQVDATGSGFIKTIGGYCYRFDPPDRTAMAIY